MQNTAQKIILIPRPFALSIPLSSFSCYTKHPRPRLERTRRRILSTIYKFYTTITSSLFKGYPIIIFFLFYLKFHCLRVKSYIIIFYLQFIVRTNNIFKWYYRTLFQSKVCKSQIPSSLQSHNLHTCTAWTQATQFPVPGKIYIRNPGFTHI